MRLRVADWVLIAVTVIWGGTFLAAQHGLQEIGPVGFVAARFGVATLALLLLFGQRMKSLTRQELYAGAGIGLTLFLAYVLQTVGLNHTTSSKSAFITATYVPLVPVIQLILFAKRPSLPAWVGAAVSFSGLALLSFGDGFDLSFNAGEWLTLAAAAASALQIVLIGKHAPDADPVRLTIVQLALVAVLSFMAMPVIGETFPAFSAKLTTICIGMGVLGTAVVLVAMNWAQRTVPATRATLIYAMEPVWAGVIGALAGERLGTSALIGSALIVGGILASQFQNKEETEDIATLEAA